MSHVYRRTIRQSREVAAPNDHKTNYHPARLGRRVTPSPLTFAIAEHARGSASAGKLQIPWAVGTPERDPFANSTRRKP